MAGSLTVVGATTNQINGKYDYEQIFIFDNKYQGGQTFLNNTGAEAEFTTGLVLGRVAASEKLVPLDPAAVDGSQYPVGILASDTGTLAIAGETTVTMCVYGDVNENKVTFNGATTFASVVDLRTLRDRIASDTMGINLVVADELSEFDNE
jgi:hypothetical protein